MRFSVIIPSRLEPYPSSAKDKEHKLVRAVNSVLSQSFDDLEIHVIGDGCQKTVDIVQSNIDDTRVHLWNIKRQKLWSGGPRNKGIDEALGEFIIYLDIDDVYGPDHLRFVNEELKDYDWVWYNDIRYKPKLDIWYENQCNIRVKSKHGTSNICHKRSLGLRWQEEGRYAHDYLFVQKLLPFTNHTKIRTPEYYVCHIPGTGNNGGYDL